MKKPTEKGWANRGWRGNFETFTEKKPRIDQQGEGHERPAGESPD